MCVQIENPLFVCYVLRISYCVEAGMMGAMPLRVPRETGWFHAAGGRRQDQS